MSNYLMKYKGIYRLKVPIDKNTNDFPKKLDDTNEDIDMYIDCRKGQISHYGHGILQAYIPKLGSGRNILKAIGEKLNINIEDYTETKEKKNGELYKDKEGNIIKFYNYKNYYKALEQTNKIWDIIETDEEIIFKFKDKNINLFLEYMQPKTGGASISPFSTRNIKKSCYDIPDSNLQEYKKITDKLGKGNTLIVSHLTKQFISNIPKNFKQFKGKNIKAMQKKEALKSKEFIHKIKLWNEYIKFLKENIK